MNGRAVEGVLARAPQREPAEPQWRGSRLAEASSPDVGGGAPTPGGVRVDKARGVTPISLDTSPNSHSKQNIQRERTPIREGGAGLPAGDGAISGRERCPFACLPLGVVPKKNGKLRLIHDERYINAHMKVPKFKNEGLDAVADMVESGDLLAKLDLKDSYYHIPIAPASRDYLGFEIDGEFFVWNVLPFGLAISPYVFVKTIRPTLQLLRAKGIKINAYMDDFLLAAHPDKFHQHLEQVLATLRRLSWHLNFDKCDVTPTRMKEYLGMVVDTTDRPTFKVPREKINNARHQITRLLHLAKRGPVRARDVASVAGLCVSLTRAVLPACLLLRSLYRCVATAAHWEAAVVISEEARTDLRWWRDALQSWNGRATRPLPVDLEMGSDASSEWGWGGHMLIDGKMELARGTWGPRDRQLSINYLELLAVK